MSCFYWCVWVNECDSFAGWQNLFISTRYRTQIPAFIIKDFESARFFGIGNNRYRNCYNQFIRQKKHHWNTKIHTIQSKIDRSVFHFKRNKSCLGALSVAVLIHVNNIAPRWNIGRSSFHNWNNHNNNNNNSNETILNSRNCKRLCAYELLVAWSVFRKFGLENNCEISHQSKHSITITTTTTKVR